MSAFEYFKLEDENWDDKEWEDLAAKENNWIEVDKSRSKKMRFIIFVALVCGFLFTLGKGFIVIKTLGNDDKIEDSRYFTDSDVTSILNQIAAADANGAQTGDITLDYQNMASHHDFTHDNAPNPLFKSVSSTLVSKPTYTSLASLLALYTTPDSGADESLSEAKQRSIDSFLTTLSSTKVYQTASSWLVKNSLVTGTVQNFLTGLWFDPFARNGTAKGSSGFKYTFAGETSGGNVVGFNNWFQFYTLEKAGSVNYHGWFDRQKDVQISLQFAWGSNQAMLRNFLVGTSPEFDLMAYTICGLAGNASGNSKTCSFTLQGNPVTLTVETITANGKTYISTANPAIGTGGSQQTTPNPTSHPDGNLQALVDKMWSIDEDKAQPGDIVLNWGNKVSGSSDTTNTPLFTKVNEDLFKRPVYAKLIDIYNKNLFHPQVCTAESAMDGDRKTQLDDYLRLLTNTSVFQASYSYLVDLGVASSDFETFYTKVFNLWYGTYSRCSGNKGSSGWEHVYSGEWKGEEIDGQHNWVRYYLLEKAGDINYHGYYSHENDLIGTFQYEWKGYLKKTGGFFISTSPSFDLSIFTTCVLTKQGGNACKFNVDGNKISVTSYHQSCDAGTCLSTSYPSDE
ncbi:hypothetical protein FO519_007921 [Halicephalobus sp. NKZ332]|nr:hypothetical protein FO519_007921 [Halicephalobus sp. NKZ332]